MAFNTQVAPNGYNAIYGGVPGPLSLPESQYSQVGDIAPGLPNLTSLASGVIGSELGGNLSTGTEDLLQNEAAGYGVSVGLPWSTGGNSIPFDNFLQNIGLTSEELSNTGFGNYMNFLTGVGSQTINPSLASNIQEQNSITAAAPNPAWAAYGQQLEQQEGQSEALATQAMMQGFNNLYAGGGGSAPSNSAFTLNPGAYSSGPATLADLTGNPDYGMTLTGGGSLPTDATSWDELLNDVSSPAKGAPVLNPAGGT